MDTALRIFAGIFFANVAIVGLLGFLLEVRRRRDQRELRDLELLYEAPSPPSGLAPTSRVARLRTEGKHVAIAVRKGKHVSFAARGPRRQGVLHTAPLVLAVVSIVVVVAAAFVSSVDRPAGTTFTEADGIRAGGSAQGSTIFPEQSANGSNGSNGSSRSLPLDTPGGQGAINGSVDLEVPGGNVVVSGGEETVPAVVAAVPASPTSIIIEWEPVPDATGYVVDRWVEEPPQEPEGWLMIAQTAAGDSTYTDTGLEAATTYYYRVTAMLETGEIAPASDVVAATTMSAPPLAPDLTVKAKGTSALLHWTDVADETGYRVERLADGEADWRLIATTGVGEVAIKDRGLTAGVTYRYRVIATGLGGDSEPSDIEQIVASGSVGGGPPAMEDPEPEPDAPDETQPAATDPAATDPAATDPAATEPDALPSG